MILKDFISIAHEDTNLVIIEDYGGFEYLFEGTKKEIIKNKPQIHNGRKFLIDSIIDYILPEDDETLLIFVKY